MRFIGVLLLFLGISALANSQRYRLEIPRAGQIVLTNGKTVSLEGFRNHTHQIWFEDKFPGANWAHPAAILGLDAHGKTIKSISVNFPPRKEYFAKISEPSSLASNPNLFQIDTSVKFNIDPLNKDNFVKQPENFYAFFFNGQASKRHWNDFAFLYRVLTQVYGYKKENIIIADSNFKESRPDLDGDGTADITHGSRTEDIYSVFASFSSRLNPSSQLLVVINDHGSRVDDESSIITENGEIVASEFGKILKKLPTSRILAIYQQCFSGGFVRPTVNKNRVAMAASTDTEFSWATIDYKFDEFLYLIITAFAKQTHKGIPVDSDANKDGKISAQEAFAYAVLNNTRRESPNMEASRNSGDSAKIGLGF